MLSLNLEKSLSEKLRDAKKKLTMRTMKSWIVDWDRQTDWCTNKERKREKERERGERERTSQSHVPTNLE